MRFVILFLFLSFNASASEVFWSKINEGKHNEYYNKMVTISGVLTFFQKHIKARDNYYILKIKDPNSELFVNVKLYTIRKLKRVNYFSCKEGNFVTITGRFIKGIKNNRVGSMKITKKAKKFDCAQKIDAIL